MPQHTWKCGKCGALVTVLRKINEHADPPVDGEQAGAEGGEPGCDHAEWSKYIGQAPSVSFAHHWAGGGGGKGRW